MKLFIILFLWGSVCLAQESSVSNSDLSQKEADVQTVDEIIKQDLNTETSSPVLPLSDEKFAAIVQYAKGKPYVMYEKKNYLDFKDLIRFGDTIIVPKKTSRLKIITQKRCIAVLYENTKVAAPKDKSDSWRVLQGSVRWICPEQKIETIEYKNAKVEVLNGETLISKNQMLVLKPKVSQNSEELKLETLYNLKKSSWIIATKQKEPLELYEYEKKYPTPVESSRTNLTAPEDPRVFRLTLGVAPIGWGFAYHNEEGPRLSDYNLEAHGLKLGTNFLVGNKSILTFLEWGEGENSDSKSSNTNGPQKNGYKSIRNEYYFLGIGLRHNHMKSSSFYYFTGLGIQKFEYGIKSDDFSDHFGKIQYDYNIGLGAGYQKIFFSKNWISLVIGVELKVLQSLTQGEENKNSDSTFFLEEDLNPESTITTGFAHIYLGPVFNF